MGYIIPVLGTYILIISRSPRTFKYVDSVGYELERGLG